MARVAAMILAAANALTVTTAQHGAAHGNHSAEWEWGGAFPSVSNSTLALASNGIAHVQVLILAADEADAHGIEESEAPAEHIWEDTNATVVEHGGTLALGVKYELHLDGSFLNFFNIRPNTTGPHVMFFEHAPAELEFKYPTLHWLKTSSTGQDIEPTATEGGGHSSATPTAAVVADAHHDEHTGEVFLACLLITVISLVGVVLVAADFLPPGLKESVAAELPVAFASGALLAAMAVIMVPESLHLLTAVHPGEEEETKVNVQFAIAILAGFLSVASIEWVTNVLAPDSKVNPSADDEQGQLTAAGQPQPPGAVTAGGCCAPRGWAPVAWSVLLGDLLHNFVDGVAIGVAFRSCNPAFGWVVAGGAAAHEIPQEIADYIVLTTRGRMTKPAALGFNLLSGASCIVGGLIAAESDISKEFQAVLLAFGGGTYLFIGTVECFPAMLQVKEPLVILQLAVGFMLGVACIAIAVNTGHEHCEAGAATTTAAAAATGAHAGHAAH